MRVSLAVLITAFWAAMMGALLHREVLPEAHPSRGFQSALPQQFQPSRTRFGIYLNEGRIGASDTQVIPAQDGSVNIINVVHIEAPLLRGQTANVRLAIQLDPDHSLRLFRMDVECPHGNASLRARTLGDQLEVTTLIGDRQTKDVMPYDAQAMVSSSLSPLTFLPKLRVGKKWTVTVWSPLSMQMEHVQVEVKSRTAMPWDGKKADVYLLETSYANLRLRGWVTLEGELLQAELPLGPLALMYKKEVIPERHDSDRGPDKTIR